MKKLILIPLIVILYACGGGDDKDEENGKDKNGKNDTYGGALNLAISDKVESFNPKHIYSITATQVCTQIYSSLVKFNSKTLEIEPDIAKSWEVSPDLTTYSFELRDDIYFHDHPCFEGGKGRKMTVEDFIESFHYFCKNDGKNNNAYVQVFKGTVLGADDYHDGKKPKIEGVYKEGDKLVIQLVESRSTFIFKLASIFTVVLPQEAINYNGTFAPVGTGPFILKSMTDDDVLLVKNQNYFEQDESGYSLPYMDTVNFFYISNRSKQLEMFEDSKLHMIEGLPINSISEIVEGNKEEFSRVPPTYYLINKPELITQYYEINVTRKPFDNKKVRQAIAHAIDKEKIVQNVLNNQAYEAGVYGVTPPLGVFRGYDFEGIQAIAKEYNPEKAKKLLAEAGYPEGKGFPSFKLLFNTGSIHSSVATEIANQLKNTLNINMEIEGVSFSQKQMDAMFGRSDMVRAAWVADYPSPETFLSIAYGKIVPDNLADPSHLNTMRYKNEEFDKFYEMGIKSPDKEERYGYYAEAEKILIDDAAIIPLWYEERFKLKLSSVRNFETNALNYLDLTRVFVREWTEEEYQEFLNGGERDGF